MSHPAFDPQQQQQRIISLWPVLISNPTEGRSSVGLAGWLHTEVVSQYQPTDSAAAGDRTHDLHRVKCDALTTRLPSHQVAQFLSNLSSFLEFTLQVRSERPKRKYRDDWDRI